MITILKESRPFNKVEKYLLTISPAIVSMKDVADNTSIPVAGYMVFNDTNEETGECNEILSIITPDNKVYALQSATFKRSLTDIENIMEGEPFSIIKVSGKTKGNRDYINCVLDVDKLK